MKKETFVMVINSLEKQMDNDEKFAINLGRCFPYANNGTLYPDNMRLRESIILLLSEAFKDMSGRDNADGIIRWFCFKSDFGRIKTWILDADSKRVYFKSAEDLYDYLAK